MAPAGPEHPGPFCAHCNDVIGTWDPLVLVFPDGSVRWTSLAVERSLPDEAIALHRACHAPASDPTPAATLVR